MKTLSCVLAPNKDIGWSAAAISPPPQRQGREDEAFLCGQCLERPSKGSGPEKCLHDVVMLYFVHGTSFGKCLWPYFKKQVKSRLRVC